MAALRTFVLLDFYIHPSIIKDAKQVFTGFLHGSLRLAVPWSLSTWP